MDIFGKTIFSLKIKKKSNLLFLLNFVTISQLKLVMHSQKKLANDLILVTIHSSKITFITYKLSAWVPHRPTVQTKVSEKSKRYP